MKSLTIQYATELSDTSSEAMDMAFFIDIPQPTFYCIAPASPEGESIHGAVIDRMCR